MDLKLFLENTPIGRSIDLDCVASSKRQHLVKPVGQISASWRSSSSEEWIIIAPRIFLYCTVCQGCRNFNPARSFPISIECIDLGPGPRTVSLDRSKDIETGRHVDQFLKFICADCDREQKKYSLSVEILKLIHSQENTCSAKVRLAKFGEIPKPIKPINPKIKRLINSDWELYRKGADDEAAGNGIGAFAYYRRVVESSRDMILEAMCAAASKLNVKEEDIEQIRSTRNSKSFTESIKLIDHLFPSELKFNDQNALTVLYTPLSSGIHEKSDEDCLEAAAHIRTILDALGERLEQVIENEDRVKQALSSLIEFSRQTEPSR